MTLPGMANSRMKDFYDIWMLITNFEFGRISFSLFFVPVNKEQSSRKSGKTSGVDQNCVCSTFKFR